MFGSTAGQYELKVPVLHWESSKKFLVLDYRIKEVKELQIEESDKVVILYTDTTLLSLFWKPPKKKRK